jgi:hypothetical protein
MAGSWQDSINDVVLHNYMKLKWDNITKVYPCVEYLFKKGKIKYNQAGDQVNWPVQAGRGTVTITSGGADISAGFVPVKRHMQPSLAWGQNLTQRAITADVFRQTANQEQRMLDFVNDEVPSMCDDLMVASNGLLHQFFNQNAITYASGGLPFYGLPSVFTGASAMTANADNLTGTIANTNYAGKSCVLSAATVDNPVNDAWTPQAINETGTAWTSATKTFAANAIEQMQYAIGLASKFNANDPMYNPDAFFFNAEHYNAAASAIGLRQTLFVNMGEKRTAKSPVADLGIGPNNGLSWNGIPIYKETLLPANQAYGTANLIPGYLLNFNQITLAVEPVFKFTGDFKEIAKIMKMTPDEASAMNQSVFEIWSAPDFQRRQIAISACVPAQYLINPRYQLAFAAIS